jgi:phosphatidylinositol-3-phosphatase
MKQIVMALFAGLATASVAATALAHEGPMQNGMRHLDHVFLIMMENHGYAEIINNPYMPFTNQLASSAGLATNYFAVAHPSLTNYLEIVGGSNFGERSFAGLAQRELSDEPQHRPAIIG